MKRTNTKEAQELVQRRIRFYYDDDFLKRTVEYLMENEGRSIYDTAKRMVLSLQFGINEHEIDMLINLLTKNGIKIGKDNLKDLESKWKWYSNIIALNVEKMLKQENNDSENSNDNKEKEINHNYKLARFIEKLGYNTIANEIAQNKRPMRNIAFLLQDLNGIPENNRTFVESDISKVTAIKILEKYKKILKPNNSKVLKYIELERKKQNMHFKLAQSYKEIENTKGKEFDKLEKKVSDLQEKYEKIEAQMFKFIKENIK